MSKKIEEHRYSFSTEDGDVNVNVDIERTADEYGEDVASITIEDTDGDIIVVEYDTWKKIADFVYSVRW